MTRRYNICLIQPPGYVHSLAFLELGELLQYSLMDLGFEAVLQFNLLDPSAQNILIGCHLLEADFLPHIPASTIVLNTEQIAADSSRWHDNIYACARRFVLWDYSPRNIDRFVSLNLPAPRRLEIGFQPQLCRIAHAAHADIDVLFYGSLNERRIAIIEALEGSGLQVKSVFGVYGQERDALIARAKVVLNMHMYNSEIFEIVRVFYLLTNRCAVVGEVGQNTFIEPRFLQGIAAAPYDRLVATCEHLVRDERARQELQAKGYSAISEYPQSLFTRTLV